MYRILAFDQFFQTMVMVEAAFAIESRRKGTEWVLECVEEVGSKLTRAPWSASVTGKTVGMMEN